MIRLIDRLNRNAVYGWAVVLLVLLIAAEPALAVLALVIAAAAAVRARRPPAFDGLLGSARLATPDDILAAGAVGPGGLPLGVIDPDRTANRLSRPLPVNLHDLVACALFAPTGAGKSTAFLTTWLLQNRFTSAVVIDPAGELFANTAEARRRAGGRVVLLDPFETLGRGTAALNPMGALRWRDPLLMDKARALAEAVVVRAEHSHEPHWDDSAAVVLAAAILFQVGLAHGSDNEEVKTLSHVFALIADGRALDEAMDIMAGVPDHDFTVAALANQVRNLQDRERASVLSSALRHLAWANTPATKRVIAATTFAPADLRGRPPVTVYLTIPPNALAEKRGLIRAWLWCLLAACVDAGADRHARVQFVLDEYAALGRMEVVEQALTQYRKFGVRLLFAFQSVGQLETSFGEGGKDVLLSNATQVFCGIQDFATAELASKQLGRRTVAAPNVSDGSNDGASYGQDGTGSRSWGTNTSRSYGAQAREVLQPEEILRLGSRLALTFTPNLPPILTRPVPFYAEEYRRLANARHAGPSRLRTVVTFLLLWGPLAAVAAVAIPMAAKSIRDVRAKAARMNAPAAPPAGTATQENQAISQREAQAGDVIVDGLGQVVVGRDGRPLTVPPFHHTEFHPRTRAVYVVPNGQRWFPHP